MENSVAVVSFSKDNEHLHLEIAQSVTAEFDIHEINLGGKTNTSTFGLVSKVVVVYFYMHVIGTLQFHMFANFNGV